MAQGNIGEIGVKEDNSFMPKRIPSSAVVDVETGATVAEHMGDEGIHVNREALSEVAFSGEYEDLNGKPELAQADWKDEDPGSPAHILNKPDLQSDWNESNSTLPAFIRNKPDLPDFRNLIIDGGTF